MKKVMFFAVMFFNALVYSQTFDGNLGSNSLRWATEQKDFNALPRVGINSMSLKLWDNYGGAGAPSTYGSLLEIYGKYAHSISQLYFKSTWEGDKMMFRSAFYNQNSWGEWRTLLDSKSDIESSGSLKIKGLGNSYITTGNFGIGTATPSASLEVVTPSITGAETLLKLSVSDATQDNLKIANGTNADKQFLPVLQGYRVSDNRPALYLTGMIESANDIGADPITVFDARLSGSAVITRPLFSWDSYGTRKMILTSNGSLGIGTSTTGAHKLAVEGSIGAREVKVQATGWADFVFKKEYNLPKLEEVETHIKEKGHLENIPSEEEVLKNGISLGEMNVKLLQKIEELTLYMIDQNKEIKDLKIQNEELKKLAERVSKLEMSRTKN
ncbi:hypothetical protein [Flavobacterium panici]|uniref:Uncharacterized protein n=1 Tax=Flavobacterium panici TaxID=2654843 RepID=A0A9N8IY36_9FLAO|nr:hypothetical protein [Flavobacterium panici]CAC9972474.1 hypothetical protein FLAPXU55_00150 [Flavobacterium panici]